ncbi:hypothetical protein MRX96_001359 [Rhipicephalus microplus]
MEPRSAGRCTGERENKNGQEESEQSEITVLRGAGSAACRNEGRSANGRQFAGSSRPRALLFRGPSRADAERLLLARRELAAALRSTSSPVRPAEVPATLLTSCTLETESDAVQDAWLSSAWRSE